MWAALWAVGKWILGVTVKVLLWAVAHPLGTALLGLGLAAGSMWLGAQPWAGAKVLGRLVGVFGIGLLASGLGAWIAVKFFGWLPPTIAAITRAAGAVGGWWYWIGLVARGGTYAVWFGM